MKKNKHLCFTGIVIILLVVSFTACRGTLQLDKFKEHLNSGEYAWIADQKISCKESDEECTQLHLIKGDACYRLAKQGNELEKHFNCASIHLEKALDQPQNWQRQNLQEKRTQAYENLLDALYEWRDKKTGNSADNINEKLILKSGKFLEEKSDSPAATYYLNNGKYAALWKCLLYPENCPLLCDKLKVIIRDMNSAWPQVKNTKYKTPYYNLRAVVLAEKKNLTGCE